MYKVTLDEAKTRLADLVRAALHGETVMIVQEDDRTVQLVPVTRATRRKASSAKGAVVTSDDFDAPAEDFLDVMQA